MDFLKEILNEELFNQLVKAVNEHNGNEANKDNQVKLANLAKGEYVGKGKFDALNEQLTGKQTELDTANGLIAELKKGTKGNEELQGKITGYETQVADLQKQLQETKLKSAIKVGLLAEKCTDVDYVTFKLMEKLRENGETLELDENDGIKGWEDKLSGLKTQLPTQFESTGTGKKILDDNRLPEGDKTETLTKESLLKKPYAERMKIYNENPEAYNTAMKS
jgi:hypothetical protein